MRREKKIIYVTLTVILLFSIVLTLGCGSSKSTSSNQSTNISQPSHNATTTNNTSSITQTATTITVGNSPSGIAYDSKMGEMFVANHDDSTVSVILDNNILDNKNAVIATIKVGTWPTSVAYDSGQGEIYVVSNVGGSISVISDKTNNVIATVTGLTDSPNDIVYDPGKNKLFVSESQNGSTNSAIDVINDISHTVVATIPTKGPGTVIVLDAATGELFTPGDGQNIYAISDSTYNVTTIPLASYPGPAAYDPANGEIFVSLPVGETLVSGFSVIKEGNNTVTKTVTTSHPGFFAYNSVKGEMYTETANNTISIITDSGTTVIATLNLSHASLGPMAYDTSMGKLFIINRAYQGPSVNTVSVITPAS